MKQSFTSQSEQQTEQIAFDFAKTLSGNEKLLLYGNLGAGKTVFVRGLAKGLGLKKNITSPTFTLMKVYPVKKKGIKTLAHVDAYRVIGDDLLNIGLIEYLERPDAVVVIEWAEKAEAFVRDLANIIKIHIETFDDNKRKIIIN